MNDVSKLPKWAQHRIAELERRVAQQEKFIAKEGESDIWYADVVTEVQGYVPQHSGVFFEPGVIEPVRGSRPIFRQGVIQARSVGGNTHRPAHLRLSLGSGVFEIEPHSPNVISVRARNA